MVDITLNRRKIVYITPGFLLLLTAVTVLSGIELTAAVALAALVHEAGHLSAVRLRGGRVRRIRLTGCGAELEYAGAPGYADDIIVALAGPAASALLAGAGVWVYERSLFAFFADLTAVSAIYCGLNMLPLSALDGGRALYAALSGTAGPAAADRVSTALDLLLAVCALGAGVWCLFRYRAAGVLICAVFLLIACCKNRGLCV